MTIRRKRGRPPTIGWRTKPGQAFADAVSRVRAERFPISTGKAIKAVRALPEFRYLHDYKIRYLEKKYQEIIDLEPMGRFLKETRKLIKSGKLIRGTES